MKEQNCITKLLLPSLVLAVGGTAHASGLIYESFADTTDNRSIVGYQTTLAGYSQGLSGAWNVSATSNQALKSRANDVDWLAAANHLTTLGSSYSIERNGGNWHFWEKGGSWGSRTAQSSLSTSIDMSVNGTWYMSFLWRAGSLDTVAQIGLNDGTKELMFGNGYNGGAKGVAAYYGNINSDPTGNSSITTGLGAFNTGLFIARVVKSDSGVTDTLTFDIFHYDLETMASVLPSDISLAGTPLLTKTVTGVNSVFNTLELKLDGGTSYPALDEIRMGETWADVTVVPEPSTLALFGIGGLMALNMCRRRRA